VFEGVSLKEKLDSVIKIIWEDHILPDYKNHFLLKEDALKNAFYHHLRSRLGDGYLNRHQIRIFTEYHIGRERADIAVVTLKPKSSMGQDYHLEERVDQVLAIFELKYKNCTCGKGPFQADIAKVREYVQLEQCKNAQFYLGFIHETWDDTGPWLTQHQASTWAKGRVTELSIFWTDSVIESAVHHIMSY
jgi:hypothetical protein